jgi:type I site-specific restriction endonuclease
MFSAFVGRATRPCPDERERRQEKADSSAKNAFGMTGWEFFIYL